MESRAPFPLPLNRQKAQESASAGGVTPAAGGCLVQRQPQTADGSGAMDGQSSWDGNWYGADGMGSWAGPDAMDSWSGADSMDGWWGSDGMDSWSMNADGMDNWTRSSGGMDNWSRSSDGMDNWSSWGGGGGGQAAWNDNSHDEFGAMMFGMMMTMCAMASKGVGKGRGRKGRKEGDGEFVEGEDGKGRRRKGKGKGKDGKPEKGKGERKIAAGEVPYSGKIKVWNLEKKRAFVVCEEVYQEHGEDVFVYGDLVTASGAGPGDTVAFFKHMSEKTGFPQAAPPVIRLCAKEGYAHKGVYKPVEDKPNGFIECKETHDFFGRDVFVNKELSALLQAGDVVAFNVKLNNEKLPNVNDMVELVANDWQPIPADLSVTRSDPQVEMQRVVMKGKSKGMEPNVIARQLQRVATESGAKQEDLNQMIIQVMTPAPGEGAPRGSHATGEICTGTVKSFSTDNNYGFIASDTVKAKYGGDCFFSGKLVEGLLCRPGDVVEFDLGVNNRGQPQALTLRMLGGATPRPPQAALPPSMPVPVHQPVPQALPPAATPAVDPMLTYHMQLAAQQLMAQQQLDAQQLAAQQAAQLPGPQLPTIPVLPEAPDPDAKRMRFG